MLLDIRLTNTVVRKGTVLYLYILQILVHLQAAPICLENSKVFCINRKGAYLNNGATEKM